LLRLALAVGAPAEAADSAVAELLAQQARTEHPYPHDRRHRLGDFGCYGGWWRKTSAIPTPNIDRVAKEGAVFTC